MTYLLTYLLTYTTKLIITHLSFAHRLLKQTNIRTKG